MTDVQVGNLTAPPVDKTGGPSKKKSSKPSNSKWYESFRDKKNQEFQQQLTASLLKRLKVTDQTTVAAIPLRSIIVPSHVPITFRGLPRFIRQLWLRMRFIGTRPFKNLCTDANYAVFLKVIMHIAEAKLAYAQMHCTKPPRHELTSSRVMTRVHRNAINKPEIIS